MLMQTLELGQHHIIKLSLNKMEDTNKNFL